MRKNIFVFSLLIFFALFTFAHAATLVNINTADAETLVTSLQGLGIGAAKAQTIVDYRNANGPFVTIEDIQKVKGIGNGVIYANIAPFITVGDTVVSNISDTSDSSVSDTATSSDVTDSSTDETVSTYTPPPSNISIDVGSDRTALIEVPLALTASVKTKSGTADPSARVDWSFGDGSASEGSMVEKTYRYAGTYLAVAVATDGSATAQDDLVVTVKPAAVRIAAISGDGITLANDAHERLDLSDWRFIAGTGFFRIPEGTTLLPNASALFPYTVTNLPITTTASLAYPDGIVAAQYTPPIHQTDAYPESSSPVQLSTPIKSSNTVQAVVDPIINKEADIQSNENAVNAPAAAIGLAAAGAAFPLVSASSSENTEATATPVAGLFHSPWTFGFLGVIVVAGGAFVLL